MEGSTRQDLHRDLLVGLARAFGGALFFSLPLLMTMEMWWLGFYMDRSRLALLLGIMLPVLIALDHYSGFRHTSTWLADTLDGLVAFGVGLLSAAVILALFGIVGLSTPPMEAIGKIALQAVPASFGAVLASSQLVKHEEDEENAPEEQRKAHAGYLAEIFFMAVGALFLAFNVAPTEEMILLAYQITPLRCVGIVAVTLVLMHGIVYAVDFRGTHAVPEGTPWWSLFLRFTTVGYAIGFLISIYVLWTFGRLDGTPLVMVLMMGAVLGFPAGLGAAAARLIL